VEHRAPKKVKPWRGALGRLGVAVAVGIVATVMAPSSVAWAIRSVVGWDAAALVLLIAAWSTILRYDAKATSARAAVEDPGRTLVFLIALGSSAFSLFAGTVILRDIGAFGPTEKTLWTVLALGAVALSWLLTHTVYGLRYAHLFYRAHHSGGLQFPGEHPPSEIDFAYFSFTLGMCYQVSDVAVTSSRIRRTVLGHSLLSFVYNTTILALTLNVIFGWLGGG